MNAEDRVLCELPRKRTGLRVAWLAAWPMWKIACVGLLLYAIVVVLFSSVEFFLTNAGVYWVKSNGVSVGGWWDILYFNFASILTIGYGDYTPSGTAAHLFTVMEAFLGTGILGLSLAALTAKFLSPPPDAIVFSKYAYYCTDQENVLVIFVNTSRNRLLNAEISSYFKLGADWEVSPAVRSPFITGSVQTFFAYPVPEADVVSCLDEPSDAFRFGISGQLGGLPLSVAIEYKPADIIVIPNRLPLTHYAGFWKPDFSSPEFRTMFHYRPEGAETLPEYVQRRKQERAVATGAQ